MTQTPLLQRIQKLINMASGASNTAEAEAFAAKVQELLLKHHLSLSDVEAIELGTEKVGHSKFDLSKLYRRRSKPRSVAPWQRSLASAVARAHLCSYCYFDDGLPIIVFAGQASDREVARWVFEVLVQIGIREANKAYARARRESGVQPGFKTSFREAFAARIRQRYTAQEEQIREEQQNSTALVRLDTARGKAREYMVDEFQVESVKQRSSTRPLHVDAMFAGRKAADAAPIKGRPLTNGGTDTKAIT